MITSRRTSSDIDTTCRPCRSTISAKCRASLGVRDEQTSRILSDTSLKLCFSSFQSNATNKGGDSCPSSPSSRALPFAGKADSYVGCRLMLSTTSGPITIWVCLGAWSSVSSRNAMSIAQKSLSACRTLSGTAAMMSSSVCSDEALFDSVEAS